VGELGLEDGRVVWHELPRQDLPESKPFAGWIGDLLVRYFAGEVVGFEDVALDLDWCTLFQRRVAEALRAVPYGETVTYGELAALAGHPNAQRAAGSFCARNRMPLLLPCHRVVAAGGLGSYGSLGLDYKRRLLELEGVAL
jgi:methylated-DNA-[protein]-cysteine S-methyltransferase